MNKSVFAFVLALILVAFSVLSPACPADAEEARVERPTVFRFPSALERIEDEAFERTAVQTAIFYEGLLYIGEGAFANARHLTDVYIPSSVEAIAATAFPVSRRLRIHGVSGTRAEEWAKEHKVTFMPDYFWIVLIDAVRTPGKSDVLKDRRVYAVNPLKLIRSNERAEDEGRSMRPQERPELHPIDYRFP